MFALVVSRICTHGMHFIVHWNVEHTPQLHFVFDATWCAVFAVLNRKIWMVVFEHNLSLHIATFEWRRYLNHEAMDPLVQSNRYLANRSRWGNKHVVASPGAHRVLWAASVLMTLLIVSFASVAMELELSLCAMVVIPTIPVLAGNNRIQHAVDHPLVVDAIRLEQNLETKRRQTLAHADQREQGRDQQTRQPPPAWNTHRGHTLTSSVVLRSSALDRRGKCQMLFVKSRAAAVTRRRRGAHPTRRRIHHVLPFKSKQGRARLCRKRERNRIDAAGDGAFLGGEHRRVFEINNMYEEPGCDLEINTISLRAGTCSVTRQQGIEMEKRARVDSESNSDADEPSDEEAELEQEEPQEEAHGRDDDEYPGYAQEIDLEQDRDQHLLRHTRDGAEAWASFQQRRDVPRRPRAAAATQPRQLQKPKRV